jgi:hypothetical protein
MIKFLLYFIYNYTDKRIEAISEILMAKSLHAKSSKSSSRTPEVTVFEKANWSATGAWTSRMTLDIHRSHPSNLEQRTLKVKQASLTGEHGGSRILGRMHIAMSKSFISLI